MRVEIETKDQSLIQALRPIIDVAREYDGHMNRSYTHGSEWIPFDNAHKRTLFAKILALPASKQFVIGTGGSHIWVAKATKCDTSTRELSATDIHDLLLLITDATGEDKRPKAATQSANPYGDDSFSVPENLNHLLP